MEEITVALLSYNKFSVYKKKTRAKKKIGPEMKVIVINGVKVLLLFRTFYPKSRTSVLSTDPNWQELLKHKETLKKIYIFAGKKKSGALEIIDLACKDFFDKKEILTIPLCHHNLKEKLQRLALHGIPKIQSPCFRDWHLPCKEGPFMKGLLYDYAGL
jgi:hypothetical protein